MTVVKEAYLFTTIFMSQSWKKYNEPEGLIARDKFTNVFIKGKQIHSCVILEINFFPLLSHLFS